MEHIRVTSTEQKVWAKEWQLYKQSFPLCERRRLRMQKKIMDDPMYHFDSITDEGSFVGFIFWWEFDDVRYIEHFATSAHLRGRGYGRRIIQNFISDSDIPVILEVEHPTNEMSRRRIEFYKRAGFVLNEHPYNHPPYRKGGEPVSLMLMTYPRAIIEDESVGFIEEKHPIIHSL